MAKPFYGHHERFDRGDISSDSIDGPEWRITAKEAREMRQKCQESLERRGQTKAFWIRGRSAPKKA